jgi:hypothetical protein
MAAENLKSLSTEARHSFFPMTRERGSAESATRGQEKRRWGLSGLQRAEPRT